MYWLRCQEGLFYQVMRLLRDAKLGGRLHIVICIRDLVLSSVFRSEHQTRYREEPHISLLKWDRTAVLYFLQRKIEQLEAKYFTADPDLGRTLTSWLGLSSIHNRGRNIDEPIEQYLLRHTRLLPRDIVTLGNYLCREISKNKTYTNILSPNEIVETCVHNAAKVFGDEQLTICGNQISSNIMPEHAATHGYSEVYTGDKEHIRRVTDDLKTLVRAIGKDHFLWRELMEQKDLSRSLFDDRADPFSVIWQNGLLGYLEETGTRKRVVFYSEDAMDDFNLPEGKTEYVFHSCLIDSAGIRAVGDPVVPFNNKER
jgi:hypothetical protein